jgi:predicted nucleotide-binding protein
METSDRKLSPTQAASHLAELRHEAADPHALYRRGEAARESWKSRVMSVVSLALGPESDLVRKLRENRYSLVAWTTFTPDSAWEDAFVSGVSAALGYVDAAIFELSLLADADEEPSKTQVTARTSGPEPRAVFVIHGRNEAARAAIFDFLRAVGLLPTEFAQAIASTGKPSPYVGEVLDVAFANAQAVLVLMTPDDEAQLRQRLRMPGDALHETRLTPQARANVLFEAGMAMARDDTRTVLVELGRCRPFSDLGGRHVLRLDNSTQRRQELAQRLQNAGLPVDLTGTEWHTKGDFDAAIAPFEESPRESLVARLALLEELSREEKRVEFLATVGRLSDWKVQSLPESGREPATSLGKWADRNAASINELETSAHVVGAEPNSISLSDSELHDALTTAMRIEAARERAIDEDQAGIRTR